MRQAPATEIVTHCHPDSAGRFRLVAAGIKLASGMLHAMDAVARENVPAHKQHARRVLLTVKHMSHRCWAMTAGLVNGAAQQRDFRTLSQSPRSHHCCDARQLL